MKGIKNACEMNVQYKGWESYEGVFMITSLAFREIGHGEDLFRFKIDSGL